MSTECPFLFYQSEENQDYLVSAPIHAVTISKDGVKKVDYINVPVCIKNPSIEANAHCMVPKFVNCTTYNE
jgi:hypothetical protein